MPFYRFPPYSPDKIIIFILYRASAGRLPARFRPLVHHSSGTSCSLMMRLGRTNPIAAIASMITSCIQLNQGIVQSLLYIVVRLRTPLRRILPPFRLLSWCVFAPCPPFPSIWLIHICAAVPRINRRMVLGTRPSGRRCRAAKRRVHPGCCSQFVSPAD